MKRRVSVAPRRLLARELNALVGLCAKCLDGAGRRKAGQRLSLGTARQSDPPRMPPARARAGKAHHSCPAPDQPGAAAWPPAQRAQPPRSRGGYDWPAPRPVRPLISKSACRQLGSNAQLSVSPGVRVGPHASGYLIELQLKLLGRAAIEEAKGPGLSHQPAGFSGEQLQTSSVHSSIRRLGLQGGSIFFELLGEGLGAAARVWAICFSSSPGLTLFLSEG